SGRSSIEVSHLIFVCHVPKSSGIGPHRNALKHDGCSTCQEWTINCIGMACNPPDIGCTPVDIPLVILKDIFEGVFRKHHVPCSGMNHSFGFTCRSRGV